MEHGEHRHAVGKCGKWSMESTDIERGSTEHGEHRHAAGKCGKGTMESAGIERISMEHGEHRNTEKKYGTWSMESATLLWGDISILLSSESRLTHAACFS